MSGPAIHSLLEAAMQESLLTGQVRVLEMLAQGKSLEQVLTGCLEFCEANSPDMLTSILLLDPDGIHVRHGAAPSLPPEYIRLIDGQPIGPSAGSCGTAAFRKEQVIVEDIVSNPLWAAYKEAALPFGLRACWSTPIFDADRRVLGTFAIYYRKPCLPKQEHFHLIGIITHVAGIAIASRRAEVEKRQMFERISDAFVALDPEWRFTYVNSRAALLFDCKHPENLIGRVIWEKFPGGRPVNLHLACEKAMKKQVPVVFEEFHPLLGKWIECRIYPSAKELSVYFHDVTERRRAEERIRQSEKMAAIGQLAGGIAHDFNNQLSVMLGYAGLLENRVADPELKRFAASIVRAANRSGDLTRNLLTFSRQGHVESVPIDFHELIKETVELLGPGFDKRIVIRKSLLSRRSYIMGDPATLQNALLNLSLNARDAMPDGGSLDFATGMIEVPDPAAARAPDRVGSEDVSDLPAGAYLHLSVTDTGTGMTEDVKKRIFEPFFTTKPVGKGTGMGMASVFGTVRAHRGRITMESGVGCGTSFHILLPLARSAEPSGSEARASAPGAPPMGLRVLVVDDESQVRDLITDMLQAGGHTVIDASGGRQALEIFRARWRDIDLVILDMVMTDIDGHQTCREMRRINPEVKAIISSGYSPDGKIKALLDEGAKGFLQKPYRKDQLDKLIAGALD
jgi:signal transduction histidine kinase